MLKLKTVIKGHCNTWGDYSLCTINEEVFFEEFENENYDENCNVSPKQTFTIKDQTDNYLLTICGNHIKQLKKLGVKAFMNLYSSDICWEDFDRDGGTYAAKEIFQTIIDNLELFNVTS